MLTIPEKAEGCTSFNCVFPLKLLKLAERISLELLNVLYSVSYMYLTISLFLNHEMPNRQCRLIDCCQEF